MTDTLVVDRIESNLTRLRLPKIREILEGVLSASEKKDASYLNFLDELLEEARISSAQGHKPPAGDGARRSQRRHCRSIRILELRLECGLVRQDAGRRSLANNVGALRDCPQD